MKGCGSINILLTQSLKIDVFKWNEEVTKAYVLLKAMTNPLILALPNLGKKFIIEIYALELGINT